MIKIVTWLSDWAKRTKVILDKDQVDATQSNHPIVIKINSSCGQTNQNLTRIFDEVGSNYLKIAITDNNDNQLYVEIDEWWSGSEDAAIHVKVPSISSSADEEIYFYYDNSKADNTTYVGIVDSTPAENVWDANFETVQHLSDITTSTVKDSTGNDIDGTKTAANEPIEESAKIGYGQDFDGNDDTIDYGNNGDITTGDFGVEIWIKTPDVSTNYFISKYQNGANYWYLRGRGTTDQLQFYAEESNSQVIHYRANETIPENQWTHLIFWADRDVGGGGYIDGTATTDHTDDMSADTISNTGSLKLSVLSATYLDNDIDEVRIHSHKRDSAWWKLSYQSQNDNLCTFGSEELYPAAGIALFRRRMEGS